jgi:hypothetical protein
MTKKDIDKFYMPVGLVALGIALGLGHFIKLPDFLSGFLIGLGGMGIILGLIKPWSRQE